MKTGKKINTFRAFRNRNYSLFFSGQSISQIGTWMQRTAVSWVIYTMTHSTFMLGLAIFASQFPSFLFSLLGGIVADRHHRYKILLFTQTASLIQAVLLAILVLTKHYAVWEILSFSVILGIINAFDVPARQPLVHELISDKTELPNAMALNSSMVNLARLIGPALSGIVLQKFGAGICFLLNAVSFIAVIISLLLLKLPPYKKPLEKKKITSEFSEGFTYLKHTPSISMIILMLTAISLLVLPYDTLLPVFAKIIFKGDAVTFGYIYSFIGIGAIAGTFFLASLKAGTNLKIVLLINTIVMGIGLMFFSHVSYFPLAMFFAILSGFGAMSQGTICITIIQVNADANMRGRVISYLAMAMFGMLPLGSLLIGIISQHIGAPDAMFCQGIMALIIAAVFYNFLRKDKLDKKNTKEFEEAEDVVMEKI
ncbi:MAG TPA: MFS transporter [Puia sp.]|jgi:MFS family permease|nr:MFS transporter [Puia sp.]